MKLVFLHGRPGVGKLTVGRCLQEATGYRLFHNHLVVDMLLCVFPFGSDAFVRLREEMWLSVFKEAISAGISCIFTFAPEKTVRPSFIADTKSAVERCGGTIHFVELICDYDETARRIEDPGRKQFGKLQSVRRLKELEAEGVFCFPQIESDLILDTSKLAPERAAQKIATHLNLDQD